MIPFYQVQTGSVTSNYVSESKDQYWSIGSYGTFAPCFQLCCQVAQNYSGAYGVSTSTPWSKIVHSICQDMMVFDAGQSMPGQATMSSYHYCWQSFHNLSPKMYGIDANGMGGSLRGRNLMGPYYTPCKETTDRCGCQIYAFMNFDSLPNDGFLGPSSCGINYLTQGQYVSDGCYLAEGAFFKEQMPEYAGRGWAGGGHSELASNRRGQISCCTGGDKCMGQFAQAGGIQFYNSDSSSNTGQWGYNAYSFVNGCSTCCWTVCVKYRKVSRTIEDLMGDYNNASVTATKTFYFAQGNCCGMMRSPPIWIAGGDIDQQEHWAFYSPSTRGWCMATTKCAANGLTCHAVSDKFLAKVCVPSCVAGCIHTKSYIPIPACLYGVGDTDMYNARVGTYPYDLGVSGDYVWTKQLINRSFAGGPGARNCNNQCADVQQQNGDFFLSLIYDTSTCCLKGISQKVCTSIPVPTDIERTSRNTWLLIYPANNTGAMWGNNAFCSCHQCNVFAIDEWNDGFTSKVGCALFVGQTGAGAHGACNVAGSQQTYGWMNDMKIKYNKLDDSLYILTHSGGSTGFAGAGYIPNQPMHVKIPSDLSAYRNAIVRSGCDIRYCCANYCTCTYGTCNPERSFCVNNSYGGANLTYIIQPTPATQCNASPVLSINCAVVAPCNRPIACCEPNVCNPPTTLRACYFCCVVATPCTSFASTLCNCHRMHFMSWCNRQAEFGNPFRQHKMALEIMP